MSLARVASVLGLASLASAGFVDFEDLEVGQPESGDFKVWQQFDSSDNIVFGMVRVLNDGGACNTVTGGNCQYWYEEADPALRARPILAHFGPGLLGFVGPLLPAGTCGANGAAGPGPGATAAFCSVCCDTPDGSGNVAQDVPVPGQQVFERFVTDRNGLSNPNNIRIFAVFFSAGGCTTCGGQVIDVDCRNNDPNPKDHTQCEAWLVRGWDTQASANAFVSAPNAPGAWNLAMATSVISAQYLANLEDNGRDVRICDPARALSGTVCPNNNMDDPGASADCCPTANTCGRRAAAWCALTEYGPEGARHPRDPNVGDGLTSSFNLISNGAPIQYITVEWAGTKVGNSVGLAFDNFDTDNVVTDVPTNAPCVACGDPHFYGFSGGAYDVMGEAGHVYNIISDYDFQLNAKFVAGRTAHNTTYFGEVGLKVGEHQASFNPDLCSVVVDEEVQLPRGFGRFELNNERYLNVKPNQIELETERYGLTFDCVSKSGSSHFNLRSRYLNIETDDIPHGILGQSADGKMRQKLGSQGEGAIEGVYQDYEVSDLFADDFRFNKFGLAGVARRRLLSLEDEEQMNYLFAAHESF